MKSRLDRPTVWVLKEQLRAGTPFDYSAAYAFGDVEFITTFDPPIHPKSTILDSWCINVYKFINEYDPERDYLVPTGSPLGILMLGIALGCSKRKPPRILLWNRFTNLYVPTAVSDSITHETTYHE